MTIDIKTAFRREVIRLNLNISLSPEEEVISPSLSAGKSSDHMHISHRLARGASVYLFVLLVGKGLAVILQITLGRYLGSASYGLYTLGYSIVTIALWVGRLGLDQGVLRYCALYRVRKQLGGVRRTFRYAVWIAITASTIMAIMIAAGSGMIARKFFIPTFASVLAIFAISMPLFSFAKVAASYLQSASHMFQMSVLENLAQPAVSLLLMVAVIGYRLGLAGAVGAFVIGMAVTAGQGIYYVIQELPRQDPAEICNDSGYGSLVRYSLVMMLVGLSYQLLLRAPILLLGHLSSKAEVGLFSAGATLALSFGFASVTIVQPAMPMMVDLYEARDFVGLQRLYLNATRWTLAMVVPFFLFISLFRAEFMGLFGHDFNQGGRILLILSIGWLIYYGIGPADGLLGMTGRQNLQLGNLIVAVLLCITLNWIMIGRSGANGAALATSASIAAWGLIEYVEVRLLYKLSPWSSATTRVAVTALITTIVTVVLRPFLPWILLVVLAASIYTFLYLRYCLDPGDRIAIVAALRKPSDRLQLFSR